MELGTPFHNQKSYLINSLWYPMEKFLPYRAWRTLMIIRDGLWISMGGNRRFLYVSINSFPFG